jgi:hypothetical protein
VVGILVEFLFEGVEIVVHRQSLKWVGSL